MLLKLTLSLFSKTFEEFTLFIVPFVPGVVRGKIFRVLESLSKYKQQSGELYWSLKC